MSNRTTPYLSIVAASRNDNHGGDMLKRMHIFVRGLIHQCSKFQLPCELIMVEWNPPADKPLLHEILPKPAPDDFLQVRYVIVPPEVHNQLKIAERLPLFQMIAKNVGIRRARAEFVLCTNVDLLFSDALFEFLAKRTLQPGWHYRCNRCDIPNDIDENWPVEKQLAYAEDNILLRLGKDYRITNLDDGHAPYFKYPPYFALAWLYSRLKPFFIDPYLNRMYHLDLHACGDFTLMSKQDWIRIEGYPELELYSIHIDSMALFAADALGIRQKILPKKACTYHIAHTGGWEFKTPMERIQFSIARPMLDLFAVKEAGLFIMEKEIPYGINGAEWGYADKEFREIVP